jgi:transcriptional regulator with XRE-family HTH domain
MNNDATELQKRVGLKLKRLREAKGEIQFAVAKNTGIPVSTISDIELGKNRLNIGLISILAAYYHITLDELLAG